MQLEQLLSEVAVIDATSGSKNLEIEAVAESLSDVVGGTLFACVVGSTHDNHASAQDAVDSGAVALLVERHLDIDVPQVQVADVRAALAPVAAAFYGHPASAIKVVGVTGTNGKTTVTHMLSEIGRAHGWQSEVIGTLNGVYTTPPALILQRTLAEMRDRGVQFVAVEVSSAALVQHRADAIRFAATVFTNLTQDHLDYHGTMARYFEAKAMLFESGRGDVAIVNIDDEYGKRIRKRSGTDVQPYSLADVSGLQMSATGTSFEWSGLRINLPLLGEFNVMNALAAATAAHSLGVPQDVIAGALESLHQVPGRLESIRGEQPFAVLVDFAHTPDGLDNVLRVGRDLAMSGGGKVSVVFGCGGDRDADKRPQMGAVAAARADRLIITSDNPRSEAPDAIASAISDGVPPDTDAVTILDRRDAIQRAIEQASNGDVVIIAGKGHESTQETAGVKTPFDDRTVAREVLGANYRMETAP